IAPECRAPWRIRRRAAQGGRIRLAVYSRHVFLSLSTPFIVTPTKTSVTIEAICYTRHICSIMEQTHEENLRGSHELQGTVYRRIRQYFLLFQHHSYSSSHVHHHAPALYEQAQEGLFLLNRIPGHRDLPVRAADHLRDQGYRKPRNRRVHGAAAACIRVCADQYGHLSVVQCNRFERIWRCRHLALNR